MGLAKSASREKGAGRQPDSSNVSFRQEYVSTTRLLQRNRNRRELGLEQIADSGSSALCARRSPASPAPLFFVAQFPVDVGKGRCWNPNGRIVPSFFTQLQPQGARHGVDLQTSVFVFLFVTPHTHNAFNRKAKQNYPPGGIPNYQKHIEESQA